MVKDGFASSGIVTVSTPLASKVPETGLNRSTFPYDVADAAAAPAPSVGEPSASTHQMHPWKAVFGGPLSSILWESS